MIEDSEFAIFDYNEEVNKIKKIVDSYKKKLTSNKIEAIPSFNEIFVRELDAIVDTLKIGHFHASARCTRAALELAFANLFFYTYGRSSSRLTDSSFSDKYGLARLTPLTHKKKSPLLRLVTDGVLDDTEFYAFCEVYRDLSTYVHYRVTYHLAHVMPNKIKSEQWYAEALRLSGKEGKVADVVKATMVKYTIEPAFDVLGWVLSTYDKMGKNENRLS